MDVSGYDDEMRAFAESLLAFESTDGEEAEAAAFVEGALADLGFETTTWEPDPAVLAAVTTETAGVTDREGPPVATAGASRPRTAVLTAAGSTT